MKVHFSHPTVAIALLLLFNTVSFAQNCKPKAGFTATRICEGAPTSFSDQSTACSGKTIASRFWYFNDRDASVSRQDNPEFTYSRSGTFSVALVVVDSEGERDSVTQTVEVVAFPNRPINIPITNLPGPTADFSYSLPSSDTPETIEFSNQSSDANNFVWYFGTGDSVAAVSGSYTYPHGGTFEVLLLAVNEEGCIDSAIQTITIKPSEEIILPTAFTPDGDGTNDVLKASMESVQSFQILIFDRGGETIYQSQNPYFQWDGTYMGTPMPSGTYPTIIKAIDSNGNHLVKQGSVTILL